MKMTAQIILTVALTFIVFHGLLQLESWMTTTLCANLVKCKP
jgi:hypothetical protein